MVDDREGVPICNSTSSRCLWLFRNNSGVRIAKTDNPYMRVWIKKKKKKKKVGWLVPLIPKRKEKMFEPQQLYTRAKTEEFDLESGETLYPGLSVGENQLRWGFIRKVYGILSAQIVLTTLVSVTTVFYTPINDLLKGNSTLLLILLFLPFICTSPSFLIPVIVRFDACVRGVCL